MYKLETQIWTQIIENNNVFISTLIVEIKIGKTRVGQEIRGHFSQSELYWCVCHKRD